MNKFGQKPEITLLNKVFILKYIETLMNSVNYDLMGFTTAWKQIEHRSSHVSGFKFGSQGLIVILTNSDREVHPIN